MTIQFLHPGEIVQLHPLECKNPIFAGCFMVVTELRNFGAVGYIQCVGEAGKPTPSGPAYYRATWPEMKRTGGTAPWTVGLEP